MKQGKLRFDHQLNKVETLLNQAKTQENPALWLFANDLRTPMFMLEALTKLYGKLHDEKIFTGLNETFKSLEDTLGGIDYYAAFEKEFLINDKIPATVTAFLTRKKNEKIQFFNDVLLGDGWLNGKQWKRINDKLMKVDWLEEAKEIKLLKAFYAEQIGKIEKFGHLSYCPQSS
jgi:hypothetical protein